MDFRFTQLRFLEADLSKCLRTAIQFENETISRAHNAETYSQNMMRKLAEISSKRNQNMGGMMNGNGPQMTPGQMPGDMSMNPNAMAARGQQQPNLGMQQPQMPNNSMNQLGAPVMQPNMSQNSHHQQQQHMNTTPNPQQQAQAQQPTQAELQETAARMMASLSEDKKANIRNGMMRTMNEQQRQQAAAQKKDPLITFVFQRARQEIMARKAAQAGGGQQQQNMQMGNAGGVNMAQAGSQQGNGFDFTAIMGQQANALKLQESGEQVVPASNNPNAAFQATMNAQNAQTNGINPAMLGNGNGQGGPQMPNNLNQQQMQMLAIQREKQRQEQMRTNARNQAMQQAQLQNQGIGPQNALNGAAGGSPAMTMLNRPMQPPGSQTPNTPQQPNRAPNMQQPNQQHGQTPANGANALLQHHQSMVNRNNTGVNMQGPLAGLPHHPIFDNPQALNIVRTMPPTVIERLRSTATTAPNELPNLIRQWAMAQQRRSQTQNMQMGGPQAGNQGGMNGMNNGIPDMNMQQSIMPQGQPQLPPGMDPSQLQARMQQQQQQQQLQQQQHQQQQQQQGQMQQGQQIPPDVVRSFPPQLRSQAMLSRPFPQSAPTQLGFAVPPQVRLWGQLKQHIEQHQNSLQPGTIQRFMGLISKWFIDHPEELEAGVKTIMMQRQQQQQQQQQGQQPQGQMGNAMGQPNNNTMAMPNGGAPTAQMMQPNPQMPQGPGNPMLGQGQFRMPPQNPVGPQDIAMFRQKVPQAPQMTDDQIRNIIEQSRRRSMANQNNALKQAQMQNQLAQNAPGAQGNQQQRPPSQAPGHNVNEHMQPGSQQQAGQKRTQPASSNDDVMEIPNPNAQQNKARAAPFAGMKLPNLTPDQIAKLGPQEREQLKRRYESLRQANAGARAVQGGMPPAIQSGATPQQTEPKNAAAVETELELRRTVQRLLEEVNRQQVKGPPVQQDAAASEKTTNILRRIYMAYTQVDKTFTAALRLPEFSEERIKQIMRAKIQVYHNWDASTNGVKGYLSLSLQEVQNMQQLVQNYLQGMAQARARGQLNQQAAQQAQNQAQQQAAAAKQAGQASAMEKTGSKHGRKASSSKPPPAPTDNKSFDWATGVASPHGVPKYEPGATQLTPDKLKFPPNKKRRTGQADSAGSTPAGQGVTPAGASPSIGGPKASSPEQARKAQLKIEAEERDKKRWKCNKDLACEASIEGFETEDELKAHFDSAHKEIENPLQFLLENAAESLGVDLEGKPLPGKASDKSKSGAGILPPKTAAAMKRDPSLNVRTPSGQTITPSTPATGSKGAAAPNNNKQGAAASDASKPKTLKDAMAEKMGFEPTANTENEPATSALTEEEKLWAEISSTVASGLSSFEPFEFGASDAAQIDDWGLRPEVTAVAGVHSSPETTPETDSQSSRSSDVSANDRLRINMEWDAFGNGDVAVPEMLNAAVGDLGLDNATGKKQEESTQKPAAEDNKAEGKKTGADVDVKMADLDWSSDAALTWDSLFAGQTADEMQFDFTGDAPGVEMDFVF